MSVLYPEWPDRVLTGAQCPHGGGCDGIKLADTKGCEIASGWLGMCPCAAVLSGYDTEWRGYDSDGNELPQREGGSSA